MSAFLVTPAIPSRPFRRVWLPLTLSLALHALLALAAVFFTAGAGASAGASLPVNTVVLADGGGTIILDDPAGGGVRGSAPQRTNEESSEEMPFSAVIEDALVVTPVPVPTVGGGPPATESPGEGSGGGAGGAGTGVLRAPAGARKVVYVIDRSISMGMSGALPVAKRELRAGVDALADDARFAVILYNRLAEPLTLGGQAGLVPATEANRAEAARLVGEVRAQGGTDHVAALRQAVALEPDVIFYVTDAAELTDDQVRNVTQLNRARAAIHAVEVNNDREGREETPLKLLARLNGGTHRVVRVGR
jgi:hypothetical protein